MKSKLEETEMQLSIQTFQFGAEVLKAKENKKTITERLKRVKANI